MAASRTIIIAGAGIGGLSAALALGARGFRALVLEQAPQLAPAGAGIQLSPNATRILIGLGLRDTLAGAIVVPEEVRIMTAGNERPLATVPLGAQAEARYGAPYWIVHRGDLQQALLKAAQDDPEITLRLGVTVQDCAAHAGGLTVAGRHGRVMVEDRGLGLVGADGLWSTLRARIAGSAQPRFARRVAWRATIPADAVPERFREPVVNLWLGRGAHVVHYPVRGGREINVVAIVHDDAARDGWSTPGTRDDLLAWFVGPRSKPLLPLLEIPERWATWALYDRPPLQRWGSGPVTLLGDAAHPMLPYLAQGGAMAIEDADVLSRALYASPDNAERAFRSYERARQPRTAWAQKAARRTGRIYGMSGLNAIARNMVIRNSSGERLLARQDWLYKWGN